ncbi:uncharacterized protein [Montipora foliosa]
MLSLFVLALLHVQLAWTQRCHRLFGPSGGTACLELNGQYQWVTCAKDSYVERQSGHKLTCSNFQTYLYCWYQCMSEVSDQSYGDVKRSCKCTPGEKIWRPLPGDCYRPYGWDCDWYRNCLRRKYSCDNASTAYAISYAERFCATTSSTLYNYRRALLSADGWSWVSAVRNCLQLKLAPLVRPWITLSCSEIRQISLATHIPCYMKPDRNVPSLCDLNCTDYLKVFWSIKGSVIKMGTAWQAWESINRLWNIETICADEYSPIRQCLKDQEAVGGVMKFTKILVQKPASMQLHLSPQDAGRWFADEVGSSIANVLKWNTIVMDWMAYTNSYDPARNDTEITMVLADKKALGIVNTTISASAHLTSTILEFASAVEEGKLALQAGGYKVLVKSMVLCSDKACIQTQASTQAATTRPNDAARIFYVKFGLLGVLVFSFLFQYSFS